MAAGWSGRIRHALPATFAAAASMLALGAQPAAAAHRVTSPFDPALALPGGSGAVEPTLVVSPDGPVGILASTASGEGCAMYTVSHSGGLAQYLGRLPGGTACAITGTQTRGASTLTYTAAEPHAAVTGLSTSGGSSFAASAATLPATGAIAADPAPDAAGTTGVYALVTDPTTGAPHVAVSQDGGRTYDEGSAVIDPAQVPAELWAGSGPGAVLGNLVARRTDTGLTLYTAFATADSKADRAAQAAAHTDNLNRVYAAVGVVTPGAGGAPAVAWKDSLVRRVAPGMPLNRARPSVAVDSAGDVYVAFSDAHHVYVEESADGLQWKPNARPAAVDSIATGLPGGLVGALIPSIAGGGSGAADLAWYGATAGNPKAADPETDPNNEWNVVMAQTLDAGKTWRMVPVTNTGVHLGELCVAADVACTAQPAVVTYPDTALQVAVDPVTGAAVAAFAGDPKTPGTLSLFATRQCTGQNALTGSPVVDDCVALQPATPVLPGTSCPGPQLTDVAGDAVATAAGGPTGNLPSLDLLTVRLQPANGGGDLVTLAVNRMTTALPRGVQSATWRVMWTLGGTRHYAQATRAAGTGIHYTVGTLDAAGAVATARSVHGSVTRGPDGGVSIAIPKGAIGHAAAGTLAHNLEAATYAQYRSAPAALGPQLVDRAPDGGFGAPYAVGTICAPASDMPDAPIAVMVPVVGGAAAMLMGGITRRRSRRREHVSKEN